MIYELRSYWIEPDVFDQYVDWVNTRAQPLQREKFGFRVIGFWTVGAEDGTVDEDPPNVVWLTAWESREERERVWTMLRASPEWATIREGLPNFHRKPGNVKFLDAIAFSPLT